MERKEMLKDYKELLSKVRRVSAKMFKTGYYVPDGELYSALTQLDYYLDSTCKEEIKYYVLARSENGVWLPLYLTNHLVTFSNVIKGYTLNQIKEYLGDYDTLLKAGIIKLQEVDK